MQPQLSIAIVLRYLVRFAHEDALEHLGHVAQVKRVVELGRDGQHRAANLQVHVNGGLDCYRCFEFVRGFTRGEVASEDRLEDLCQGLFCRLRHIDDLEVAHEARRQRLTSTTRWSSSADHTELLDLLPGELRPVVVALHVDELSEQLNGRLCSIELFLWHVDIVDEDQALRVALEAVDITIALRNLGIKHGLNALTLSLGREVLLNRHERCSFVTSHLLNEFLDDH